MTASFAQALSAVAHRVAATPTAARAEAPAPASRDADGAAPVSGDGSAAAPAVPSARSGSARTVPASRDGAAVPASRDRAAVPASRANSSAPATRDGAATPAVPRVRTGSARTAPVRTGSARTAPTPCACQRPDILADRPDGTVVRHGHVVAKSHAPDTDLAALTARIAVAADPLLSGILLPPLPVPAAIGDAFTTVLHGRPLTLWPYGTPVNPEDPDAAPWEDAAGLLACLHAIAPGALQLRAPLPPMRGPEKAARAVARMHATGPHPVTATTPVLRAWAGLPAWARDEAPSPQGRAALCHGDLHLGQLVRHPADATPEERWLLIDVDDMGIGDPAWDLARPAAWYAAGLLAPDIWDRFLGAYRAAGGSAVRPDGDPWPQLDVPARALTVQTAALALAKSAAESRPLDEVEEMMIEACGRIASLPPELEPESTS